MTPIFGDKFMSHTASVCSEPESKKEFAVGGRDPAELRPAELAAHIVAVHHGYLREELPRLREMAERVAEAHGGHTPSLVEVLHVFNSIEEELMSHMFKEEQVLFPIVVAMSLGQPAPGSLEGPIDCMVHEHAEVDTLLRSLRGLSNDFTPPGDACNTYRKLFAGLRDLEGDLHQHIHLENDLLFPAALKMAEQHPG